MLWLLLFLLPLASGECTTATTTQVCEKAHKRCVLHSTLCGKGGSIQTLLGVMKPGWTLYINPIVSTITPGTNSNYDTKPAYDAGAESAVYSVYSAISSVDDITITSLYPQRDAAFQSKPLDPGPGRLPVFLLSGKNVTMSGLTFDATHVTGDIEDDIESQSAVVHYGGDMTGSTFSDLTFTGYQAGIYAYCSYTSELGMFRRTQNLVGQKSDNVWASDISDVTMSDLTVASPLDSVVSTPLAVVIPWAVSSSEATIDAGTRGVLFSQAEGGLNLTATVAINMTLMGFNDPSPTPLPSTDHLNRSSTPPWAITLVMALVIAVCTYFIVHWISRRCSRIMSKSHHHLKRK